MIRSIAVLLTLALASGCGEPPAETAGSADNTSVATGPDAIYHNARIYTVDASDSWQEALALTDGKIVALGASEEVLKLAGAKTQLVDLGGQMMMPGIHDTHMHPADAGISRTLECSFLTTDLAKVLDILRGCIAEAEPGEWIRGGQWNEVYFADNPKLPKTILDEIAPDNPVFLMDWSVHHAWVNTLALEAFAIDRDTPDPSGGVIQRDVSSGEPTGLLFDNAAYNKRKLLPRYTEAQTAAALKWALDQVVPYGITTIKDAIVTTDLMAAYQALDAAGELIPRIKTSLTWKSAWALSRDDERALMGARETNRTSMIDPNFAKIMLDGVPMTYTSALLAPYEPNDVVGPDHRGKLMIPADELTRDVVELDRQGMSVKIHATGDAAARAALDAFEAARKASGNQDIIHEVSHAEMIHPDDVPRFKELNVAAEMCPILWYPIPGLTWETWFGKDRVPAWQVKTLLAAGALVTYGSDWPVVPTANPWPGIEAMVTRSDPVKSTLEPEFAEEAVDLKAAVRVFTHNSAIANRVGDRSGSLEVGKDADFIVLNQNIFEVPIRDVSATEVVLSVIGGEPVFQEQEL
ncbi:MAG: amidohydrolase [Pseudomonadota bacterium]